jgi:outer membrane lipoprotein
MTTSQQLRTLTFIGLFFLAGCIHPISEKTRQERTPQVTFDMLKSEPDAFIGKQLLLGGVIVSAEKAGEETVFEMMQWRLNRWGEPTSPSNAENLFLIRSKQPLDAATYEPGVLVTLAGVVIGQETRLVGDNEYTYPVLQLSEGHPWESPFRYGIHRYPEPDYPHYVGGDRANRNPYDPGYSAYPYTQHWYRVAE